MSRDRYAPDPTSGPAQMAEKLRDLERRLAALEGARPLGNTTVKDGTLTLDGGGLEVLADGGYPLYRFTAEDGQVYPGLSLPMARRGGTAYNTLTAGSFTDMFAREIDTALASALHVVVPWATDAATTGEVLLTNFVGGGNTSDVITLAANSSGNAEFKWLHGQTIGAGPFFPTIRARRTSGAGNVYIWPPYQADLIDGERIGATTGGT